MFRSVFLHDAVVTAAVREGRSIILTIEFAEMDSPQPGVGYELDGRWYVQRSGQLVFEDVTAITANDVPVTDLTMISESGSILDIERRGPGDLFIGVIWDVVPEFVAYVISCRGARWISSEDHVEAVAAT